MSRIIHFLITLKMLLPAGDISEIRYSWLPLFHQVINIYAMCLLFSVFGI